MTIQDWGSIGEILGAIATIATLIYLATQIRQNTKQLEAGASITLVENTNSANRRREDERRS